MNIILIDANIYLEFYEAVDGPLTKFLSTIQSFKKNLFVTSQIVNEVSRRKLDIIAKLLSKGDARRIPAILLPKHITPTDDAAPKKIHQILQEIKQKSETLEKELSILLAELLENVSQSTDAISESFKPIFANAIEPTDEQISRARKRKELGRPPGKTSGPLGDELTWEQLLSHVQTLTNAHVWIVSKDPDYYTSFGGKTYLNPALVQELKAANVEKVFHFNKLTEAIAGLSSVEKFNKEQVPSPEEFQEAAIQEAVLQEDEEYTDPMTSFREQQERLDRLMDPMKSYREQQERLDRLMNPMKSYREQQERLDRLMDPMKSYREQQERLERFMNPMKSYREQQERLERFMNPMKSYREQQERLDRLMNPMRAFRSQFDWIGRTPNEKSSPDQEEPNSDSALSSQGVPMIEEGLPSQEESNPPAVPPAQTEPQPSEPPNHEPGQPPK